MTKMTKVQAAKQIVESNPNATRSEIVRMFVDQLQMSKAGATTYAYNLAKDAPKRVKKVVEAAVKTAEKKQKTAEKKVEATLVTVEPRTEEEYTKEEAVFDAIAAKLKAKRERDAARKREKRAAEKAAKQAA